MADKRMTEDDVVARLASGMTIGIGGWGSRRKPMSLVRAILRSDLTDLHLVSYGGPDVGLLCAAGKVAQADVRLRVARLDPRSSRTSASPARPAPVEPRGVDEGMFLLGLQAAAWRVPFLPTRVGLGSDLFRLDPTLRTVTLALPRSRRRRRRGAGGGAGARARRRARATSNRRPTSAATPPSSAPTSTSTTCCVEAATSGRFVSAERIVPTESSSTRPADVTRLRINRLYRRRRRRGAERCPLHLVRARLRPRRGVPEGVRRHRQVRRGLAGVPRAVARRCPTKPTYQAELASEPR